MNKKLFKGIIIMICSSLMACTGQLIWKLAAMQESNLLFFLAGFVLYGMGAVCMMLALRFGELSVLHPMLSFGFIVSIFLGAVVLGETVTLTKTAGIALIILGMVFLGRGSAGKESQL